MAEVVVVDIHLTLPPPCPAHLQEPREDGASKIAVDGVDLAKRLRARGFIGKIILHSADSLAVLEGYRKSCTAIDLVVEKGSNLCMAL